MSQITIEVPEAFQARLKGALGDGALPRFALEALALEALRSRLISRGRLRDLLGLGFAEGEQFLAEHGIEYSYDEEDFDRDVETLAQFHAEARSR